MGPEDDVGEHVDLLVLVEEVDRQARVALSDKDAGIRVLRKPLTSAVALFSAYGYELDTVVSKLKQSRKAMADFLDGSATEILDRLDPNRRLVRLDRAQSEVTRTLRRRSDEIQQHIRQNESFVKELERALAGNSPDQMERALTKARNALPRLAVLVLALHGGGSIAFGGFTATLPPGVGLDLVTGLLRTIGVGLTP